MPASGVEIVAELARRFAAGDGPGASALLHPKIRIEQPASLPHGGWHTGLDGMAAKATGRSAAVDVVELFSFLDGRVCEIRVFQQDTHLLLATLTPA
jgi:hypothetical protein